MTTLAPIVEPRRDQYGRYLLPDPITGKEKAWTRATTVAGTLSDRFGLEQWGNRNVVLGIAARPDLYALAASCTPEDKSQLNHIVKDAQEAAKSRSGANLGTALHRICERIDSGEQLDVPIEWRADVDAYVQTLADNSVRIHPEWMERIVIAPKAQVAGTLDRLVTVDGQVYVADLKTGRDVVSYGMGDIAIQLALYANSSLMWRGPTYTGPPNGPGVVPNFGYDPMPTVDKRRALVIHLPVGEGRCELHWVDIQAGLEAARVALMVREWRKRKDLSEPFAFKLKEVIVGDDW